MESPTVTTYVDKARAQWYVNVYWASTKTRKRISLGVAGDEDPGAILELFKREVLPGLIEEYDSKHGESPKPHEDPGAKLADLAEWYLQTHLPYLGRSEKTITHYAATLGSFIAYCRGRHVARAQQLSTRIIQEWQLQRAEDRANGTGPNRDQVLHVRRWLAVCEEAGEINELPPIKWDVPKKAKSKRFKAYPADVVATWLAGLESWRPKVWQVCAWTACTGWRIGDVLDLRWGEVDETADVIDRDQLKTSAGLLYPIGARMTKLLEHTKKGRKSPQRLEHVFLDHKGRPWEYQRLVKVLAHYHKSARWDGEPISFRDLRKSFGSHRAMQGCPPNVLKELMGHQSVELTLGYYVDVDLSKMAEWLDT